MSAKLYVGNLAYTTSEDDLRDLFSQAGAVTSVTVITDRETGRSKGFAFVEMESQADANKAIGLFNGKQVHDRTLNVSVARPREEGGRGPGRGGGGGGGRSFDRPRGGGGGGGRRPRSW